MFKGLWSFETSFHHRYVQGHQVTKILHEEKSEFQHISVVETTSVGRLLLLDGKTMVSDKDEFVYHEIMGHVSSMSVAKLEKVLIIGGGDCGIVREFAKYPQIKSIELVEIDERVIEVSKEFFPQCTSAMNDPRVKVLPTDGIEYIKSKKNEYDIIIVDSTDPEGFALGLFSESFYQACAKALKSHGVFMFQSENPFLDEFGIKKIFDNVKTAFKNVGALTAPMIIYPGVHWCFGFASQEVVLGTIDQEKNEWMSELEKDLKWYNRAWHQGAAQLSNFDKKVTGL